MKAILKLLAIFAMFMVIGCSKDDDGNPPPDNPPVTDKVTFYINTDFPDGVSVESLEIMFESSKAPTRTIPINMGFDTLTFIGQEASNLLGGSARIGLTIINPTLAGRILQSSYSIKSLLL